MLDENDDKPRRNLMVISLLFIVYALAGGDITEKGSFGFAYIKLSRPEVVEYIAITIFGYFYWSYWITHKGAIKNFVDFVCELVITSEELTDEVFRLLIESAGKNENKIKGIISHKNHIKQQLQRLKINIEPDGILEWKVDYSEHVKVNVEGNIAPLDLTLQTRLNPDFYIRQYIFQLSKLTFTTSSFRDTLLPYVIAIIAIIVTLLR